MAKASTMADTVTTQVQQSHSPAHNRSRAFTESTAVLFVAVAIYLLLAVIFVYVRVGLQYDEAIFMHGAVHLIQSREIPPFAHYPSSWAPLFGQHLPLMVMPYAGAAKFYLLTLPFKLFGPSVVIGRLISAVLGAIGIFGTAKLLHKHVNPRAGAALALILALHPNYLGWTVYDSSGVALFMAGTGLVSLGLSFYLTRQSYFSAIVLGASLGFALWGRANFIWLVAGVAISLLLFVPRELFKRIKHAPAILFGGILGGAPLLYYEILSKGYTFEYMRLMKGPQSALELLPVRLRMASEALFYDSHRALMWYGPVRPNWENMVLAVVVILALLLCLFAPNRNGAREGRWRKILGLSLVLMLILTFQSRMSVGPYHLIGYLPFAAAVCVLASQYLVRRFRAGLIVVVILMLFYATLSITANFRAFNGLSKTGGIDMWSDGVFRVAKVLNSNYPKREVKILDWGLANNLYVLTNGTMPFREIYWGATKTHSPTGWTWDKEIEAGGLFLLNTPKNLNVDLARKPFLEALRRSGVDFKRHRFKQRTGEPYADLYVIPPSN